MTKNYEVIVAGLGAAGSSTLYQLANSGVKVLGIDQFNPPHDLGSSHGETRITRQAIGEGAHYIPIVLESYRIFEELERKTGRSLLKKVGGLIISKKDSMGVHGKKEFLANTLESAKRFSIKHDVLSASELRQRFPQFAVQDDNIGYYEYGAGFLRPEQCVGAQIELAQATGAEVLRNTQVTSFEVLPDKRVKVLAGADTYYAKRLVVTAGSWVGELFPELNQLFHVVRQVQYWFDCADTYEKFNDTTSAFPIFIWDFGQGLDIYGFPAVAGKEGGIKISGEVSDGPINPRTVNRMVSPEQSTAFFEKFIAGKMPDIKNKPVRSKVCMYTVTPDHDFIIDYHPQHPEIIIASPCSGHGFKHSAGVGRLLAEMATDKPTYVDPGPFSLARFKK